MAERSDRRPGRSAASRGLAPESKLDDGRYNAQVHGRAYIAALTTATVAYAGIAGCQSRENRALWPGAKFTQADRLRATRRGLDFVYAVATKPENFRVFGHDFLLCFYIISNTARDSELRRRAREMGIERAREWRRAHAEVPASADAADVKNLTIGSYSAEQLGFPDAHFKELLRQAARRFSARDFLKFDAPVEPPRDLAPRPGSSDDGSGGRSRYDVYLDALICTYFGDAYGITLGASYKDVIRWLPAMRPYPARNTTDEETFHDALGAVAHVVYTLDGYTNCKIAGNLLPQEFVFLESNLTTAIERKDPEILGEFLDTLKAFGLDESDEVVRNGESYLLSTQNADGSWGDTETKDVYERYHTTWTAVDGLREYLWNGRELRSTTLLPSPQPTRER